eukprot:CAMPEP_0172618082 /NCGR_PEP_ID=MMETSP1068-20121228/76589_1 /TAXON_ID=35684 /ORGANISM="Pseudopedinella elastica, Strain CCMP716" /LENGTH=485 /DNA_ID=CAMNT_0013424113 /DNA_START=151 /DNA_END=1608 /DNA_ORIENTATION=+
MGALGLMRAAVFPIYGSKDIVRFLCLGGIKFFVIFCLTLTRDLKDTLVVTSCGAEAITFLKFFGVLPSSALFFLGYAKLSSVVVSKQALWYMTAAPFFVFFLMFGFCLYPLRGLLHPNFHTDAASGFFMSTILENWTFALFYVVAELYSSVSVGILFWQLANELVPAEKSTTFYPLFGQMSSLAPVLAGFFVRRVSAPEGIDMETSMRRLSGAVTLCGIAMVVLHYTYYSHLKEPVAAKKRKGKKAVMSFGESLLFLARSNYLGCMSVLVLGYGISIQFSDVLFKNMVKKQYPAPLDYQRFFADFSSSVGLFTFFAIFLGSKIISRFGWGAGAALPPLIMAILGLPFFMLIVLYPGDDLPPHVMGWIVTSGALLGLLSKATKNALFDPTLQIAYIPLDEELKVKGKAAIDVLGSRLGKSGCALLQQVLVLYFGTINHAAPAVAAIFFLVTLGWVAAVAKLSILFEQEMAAYNKAIKGEEKGAKLD